MKALRHRLENNLLMLVLLGGASGLSLLLALISQYGFGLHPCELCLYQRWPYVAVTLLALLGWWFRGGKHISTKTLLRLTVLILLGESVLAAYHAGVEWDIFPGPTACSGDDGGVASLEALKAQIESAALVSCKDAAVRVLGLSMAGWNSLWSLFLAALGLYSLTCRNKMTR